VIFAAVVVMSYNEIHCLLIAFHSLDLLCLMNETAAQEEMRLLL